PLRTPIPPPAAEPVGVGETAAEGLVEGVAEAPLVGEEEAPVVGVADTLGVTVGVSPRSVRLLVRIWTQPEGQFWPPTISTRASGSPKRDMTAWKSCTLAPLLS